ncbi:MAG: autotransporter-associated beta strand repeat-containing protein [Bacteroidota bacterium]
MLGTLRQLPTSFKFQASARLFLSAFFILFSTLLAYSQTTTWTGGGGDFNFQNPANWTFNVPVNGSNVVIPTAVASDITNVPALTLNDLTIQGSCTFAAAVTGTTLTVNGNFTVTAGSTFTIGVGGSRFNFLLSSTSVGLVDGTVVINSGVTVRLFQNDGNLTITSTGLITDNGTNPSDFTLSPGATLRIGSVDGITTSPTLQGSVQVLGARNYSSTANYAYVGVAPQNVGNALPTTINSLTINNGGGAVTLASSLTITNGLTISNGTLDIGNNNITSVASVNLTGSTLSSSGSGVVNLAGGVLTNASTSTAVISAPLNLGGTNRVITVANGSLSSDLTISGVISGGAGIGISKAGAGTLTLSGNNNYSGTTQINAGRLNLGATGSAGNGPLGTTAQGTVVNATGATLDLNGFTLVNAEQLTINGTGIANGGSISNTGGPAAFSGNIVLASASSVATSAGSIDLSGSISGGFNLSLAGTATGTISGSITAGSVSKNGSGTWTLNSANSYTGGTALNAGVLNINNASALGSVSSTFTITGGAFDNTSGSPITTLNYPMAWNGDFSFLATNALDFGTGSISLNGDRVVTVVGLNNLVIRGTLNAPSFNLTKVGVGPIAFDASPINLNSLNVNSGTFITTSNTLTLNGDFVVGAATFNNNGGTVSFVGNSPQAVAGVNYQTLSFSGSGIKNAAAAINAATVNNSATLNMATFALSATTINNGSGTVQFFGPTNGFAIGTGTVEYNGPSQTVGAGSYANLTINQSSGDATLAGASSVAGVLTLAGGNLSLGVHQLTLGTTATTTGASSSRFVVATGGGSLRKDFSAAGAFTFPIGENTGVTEYSPISVNYLTGGGPGFITVSVTDSKHPSNNSPTNFLSRFWTIATGATGTANITANYPIASVNGTQTSISAGQLSGVFNQSSNPWIKFGALGGGTLNAPGAVLSSGASSVITGIEGTNPIANAGTDKSICNNTNVTLGGAPTATGGAGGYTYSWLPATNLSATNVSNPVFTATSVGTTTYTVTVTDANGFVATDALDVTVNAIPTPSISGLNAACVGQTGVNYTTAGSGNLYSWTVTNGTITSGSGTNTISVTWTGPSPGTVQLIETIPVTLCAITTPVLNVTINPNPAPIISGTATVCAGQTGVSYSTPLNAGRTYAWTVSGGSIASGAGSNSITVNWGAAGSGSVNLIETITATGCATTATVFNVTVNPLPTPVISGSNSVCANQPGVVYSTAPSGNSFVWNITGGTITAGAGTNSITVAWGSTSPGTLVLTETIPATSCAATTSSYNVTINALPTPLISGPSTACSGQTALTYSTPANAGRSYAWSVTGGTITSGAGTNSIVVTWGGAGTGLVDLVETITATGCAAAATTFSVTVNPLPTPSISGSNSVCANQSGVTYSTVASGNTFLWAVSGGTINTGQGTNSINVTWGAAGTGSIQVTETILSSGCSVITPSLTVTVNPNPTPTISGTLTVCSGQSGVVYSTPANANRNYAWSVTGGSITSGAGTNSITVTWGASGTGTVNLTESITTTGCVAIATPLTVTVNPSPTPSISGLNSVCAGQSGVTYTTGSIGDAYVWVISGGTITSGAGTNTISVDWGTAGVGTLQLTETITTTSCSTTTPVYNVSINTTPTPTIAGFNNVCANQSGVNYSTSFNAGRSYAWTVTGGSITSGAGTNSINVTWGAAGAGLVQLTETIVLSGCLTIATPVNVTINANPTPTISGATAVCANATGVAYSTPLVSGNTYSWTIVGGTLVTGAGTNSITVAWGSGPAGTVRVLQTNSTTGCSTLTPVYNVTINPNPTPVISGLNTVCANRTGVVYSTPANAGRTYAWAITGGTITGGGTTASATVNWGAAGTGTMQVTETITATGCVVTTASYNVTKNPNPTTPVVSGVNAVCAGSSGLLYSTPLVVGNTYSWSLPGGGGTITSGGSTDQATVTWTTAGARTIRVTETITATGCFVNSANLNVTVNANPAPVISGANTVCSGSLGVPYSTPSNVGRSYAWTISGGTIATGAGTAAITVNWGAAGVGTLQLLETVIATGCNTTTALFNVNINASPTPSVSGLTSVCAGQTGVVYSTANVIGNSYSWSVTGGSITSGAGTNSIVVSWGVVGAGIVSLTETVIATGCAVTTTPYNVTVNPNPAPSIVGSNNVCANQVGSVYSTAAGAGRNYAWTVTGGTVSAGAGTNSIQVNWGAAGTGTVQLTETIISSSCSVSTPVLNVVINAPPSPAITGLAAVCANQSGVAYSTTASGNIFFWSVAGGSITSGAGTNSINVTWGSAGVGTVNLTEISLATGCIANATTFTVNINAQPGPSISGNNSVCANDVGKVYTVPLVVGNTYAWAVTGGTINGSSTNNTVVIDWGAAGVGSLQLTQTVTATGCSFTTNPYVVTINSLPSPLVAGSSNVCSNQSGVIYSTANVVGSSYAWSVSGGLITGGLGTNAITVTWDGSGIGTVSLTETTTATGCFTVATPLNVTINPKPAPSILGNNTVCAFDSGKTYSTSLNVGNTYSWSITGGTFVGPSTGNSVSVNWGAAGVGTLSVVETVVATGCTTTTPTYNVTINSTPAPSISGLSSVCANQTGAVYSTINNVGNLYGWSVAGGTIVGGLGTNSITVNWGATGVGTVTLTEAVIASGCSVTTSPYSVTINPNPTPSISGNNTVCANALGKVYTTPFVAGNSYSWSVTGGTINGVASNNSVTIDWGAAGIGTLTLTETIIALGCSVVTPTYSVNINPLPVPVITGLSTVCANQTGVSYSTPNTVGNTYTWVISGGTILSGAGTNAVLVNWGGAGTGTLTVTEAVPSSSCSTTTSPYTVIINPTPTPVVSGNNTVCANDTRIYTTPFVLGNSYSWSVTGGTISGGSNSNSVIVIWGSAGTGTLQVTESAGCVSISSPYNVTINPNPTPLITGLTSVCANQVGVVYSTPNVSGNSYSWVVSGGAIVSGGGTNSIIVNWGAAGTGSVTLTETILSSGCSITTAPASVSIGPGAVVNAGTDDEVCEGFPFNLATRGAGIATASNFTSLIWSGGTGVFSNPASLNPVYFPGVGEVGNVTLTLTANGAGLCPSVVDQFVLTITPTPTANAGSDSEICQGSTFGFFSQVTPASASNFSSLAWTQTGGTGTIVNGNTLTPTYIPGVGETGTITFTLTANSLGSCAAAVDNMVLTITTPPTVNAGSNAEVCQGPNFNFGTRGTTATASGFNTITWSGGTGSFLPNANTLNPTYVPGVGETGNIIFTLTATGNGSCATKTSTFTLTITPAVAVNAGSNAEVCEGLTFNFGTRATLATASNFNTIAWTGGSGTLTNGNTLNPIYTPGVGEMGVVTFTLTATGNGSCATQTSTMQLTITPAVNVNAGSNAAICQGAPFDFATRATPASASNFATLIWSGGAGSFSNANALNPTYAPTLAETGLITFTLTATGNGSCATKVSSFTLNITPAVVVNAGSNEEVCQGLSFNFGTRSTIATASNFNTLNWTGGLGTFTNANTLSPTYIPAVGETGVITFTLTATGNGTCATQTSTMQLTITPSVTVAAGANAEVCQGANFDFASRGVIASASNFNTLTWSGGLGSFSNANILNPIYTPGVGETGVITFTLTATGNGTCATKTSTWQLTISPAVTANAGSNSEICSGSIFNFALQTSPATATNFSSVVWTHSGTGTIFNANTLTPVYQPGVGETGVVNFTLRANGLGSCPFVTSTTQLLIRTAAAVNAGTNAETCQGIAINFASRFIPASASNFASLLWTHSGTGTIANASTLSPTYTPGVGEVGSVTFTLTATGNGVCPSVQSQMVLTITPVVVVSAGSNGQICQGATFNFSTQSTPASALNVSSVLWTHNGAGTLFNANTLAPTYFASATETGNVTFTLRGNSSGSCPFVTSTMSVNIVPAPIAIAGSNAEVCEGTPTFSFGSRSTAASSANGTVAWTHNGAGSLSSTTNINPTYTLAPADFGNIVTFTLTVTSGSAVCAPATSTFQLRVNRRAIANAPADYTVCQSPTINLSGSIGGTATTGLWSIVSGAGSLSATNVSGLNVNSIYSVDPTDVGGFITLRLTTNDPDGPASPCVAEFDDVVIQINRAASITAGPDLKQCEDQPSINLQGAIGYAPNGVVWSGGLGTFISGNSPTASYNYRNPNEINSNFVLTMTANDPDGVGPCSSVADQMNLTINPLPIVVFSGLPPSTAENGPIINLTGNQIGGLFTITPLTSSIGSTVQAPVDRTTLDPSAVTLGFNTVTYTYTNSNGCTNSQSQSVLVNPVTSIDFSLRYTDGTTVNSTFGQFEFCANVGDIKIIGSPPHTTGLFPTDFTAASGIPSKADSITLRTKIVLNSGEYFINTNGLPPGIYYLRYTYTNSASATNTLIRPLKVFASPTAVISNSAKNCISSDIVFDGQTSSVAGPAVISSWSWDYGNSFSSTGTGAVLSPPYRYPSSGSYNVRLRVLTNEGCSSTATLPIRVGDVPIVDFDWAAICTNDFTNFKDKTNPGAISTIDQYIWNFGDGNVLTTPLPPNQTLNPVPGGTHSGQTRGTFKDPEHNYLTPGSYNVTLTVNTNDGCSNSVSRNVFILLAGAAVAPDAANPYRADFESSDGGWVSEGLRISPPLATPIVISQDDWQWGPVAGNKINIGSNGSTRSWWTGKNIVVNSAKSYYDNEAAAVNGPCFDLRNLRRPMISFDYWSDFENNADGAVAQYSTDGGLTWVLLGPLAGDPNRDKGINWFNAASIIADPGQQKLFGGFGPYGWTGRAGKWKRAAFNLDMITPSPTVRDQVRIRIALGTGNGNAQDTSGDDKYDGFAFDNIYVGEKNRSVLVEHFTNLGLSGSRAADTYLDGLFATEELLRGTGFSDFNSIQYHIGFAAGTGDQLNLDNPTDPNTRAASYGVSQPPRTFMDGLRNNGLFDGTTTKLNNVEIDRRALVLPKFTLKLDTVATNKNNFISARLTITADTLVNVPLIAQVALVEDNVVLGGATYRNVLKKLLYGSDPTKPDGITITQPFAKGQTLIIPNPTQEVEITSRIYNSNNLKLIGFVQDKNTGEVYQSIIVNAPRKTNSPITAIEDDPFMAQINQVQIYPNPANGQFNFAVPGEFPAGSIWKISDQRGIFVEKGDFSNAVNGIKPVDVSQLANGVYFVLIGAEGKVPVYRKLVVINQR